MHKACDFTVWKLIKQNLNAAHLWVRSNISTSPLVFSPLLNISSVKSKQLYSRERLLYISVVLKYPACVFIFTCPRCLIVYHFKLWLSCYLCRGLPKWSIFYQCNPPFIYNRQKYATFHHRTGFRVTKLCTLSGGSLELFRLHNEYNEMRYLWFWQIFKSVNLKVYFWEIIYGGYIT